jgi:rSAM/selenodomain-associated transferase 1
MDNTVMILFFVKAPARGQVKSRIASLMGEAVVQELYRSFVLDMLQTVDQTGISSLICYHPAEAEAEVKSWLGRERAYLAQRGSDVGERMEHAFREAFSRGWTRAVLLGSDIPDLPGSLLVDALGRLDGNDAVIGPAEDGGYYLIGFRNETFLPEIFHGIPWSTDAVFSMTSAALARAGRTVHRLPAWRDIDTVHDLQDLHSRNACTDFRRSRTMRFLATIRSTMTATEGHHGKV